MNAPRPSQCNLAVVWTSAEHFVAQNEQRGIPKSTHIIPSLPIGILFGSTVSSFETISVLSSTSERRWNFPGGKISSHNGADKVGGLQWKAPRMQLFSNGEVDNRI